MSRLVKHEGREPIESSIGLINVVFLLLVFFLVAGSIAPTPDRQVQLVSLQDVEGRAPQHTLAISAEGELRYGEAPTDIETYIATLDPETMVARLLPDRAAPASRLVEVANLLRAAGAQRVLVLGERAIDE